MDILLINPRTELSSKQSFNREPPAGLIWMAMHLRMNNLDVKVVDANDSELFKLYLDLEPSIVGLTCLTNTYNSTIKLTNDIKEVLANSKIVMGGPHATFMWKEILSNEPNVDYVIRGEGEYSLLELFKSVEKKENFHKIKGLAYRSKEGIVSNELSHTFDVNLYSFPDRIDIIPNKYDVASIIANRGCPYNCSFCVRQKLFQSVRIRDPVNIIEELDNVENMGYYFANLYDNININEDFTFALCKLYKKYDIGIPWGAELRGDKLSYNLAKEIKEAGCKVIAIGVETAGEEILKLNGKFQSLNDIKKGIENAKKVGLAVQSYFVIGLPGETNETFQSTLKFIEELPIIPGEDRIDFFIATPYPGSRLYYEGEKEFKIDIIETDWDKYDTEHVIFETEDLKKQEIEDLFIFAKKYAKAFNS
jgi:radical SAM superfamily enzyme YgiQ (UPF0313 family)